MRADFANDRAQVLQHLDRCLDSGRHLRVCHHVPLVEMAQHSDPETLDSRLERARIAGPSVARAARIERVMARNHIEHQRVIPHGSCQRTDMVEGERKRHDAAPADEAISRFHPDHAAHGRRIAD